MVHQMLKSAAMGVNQAYQQVEVAPQIAHSGTPGPRRKQRSPRTGISTQPTPARSKRELGESSLVKLIEVIGERLQRMHRLAGASKRLSQLVLKTSGVAMQQRASSECIAQLNEYLSLLNKDPRELVMTLLRGQGAGACSQRMQARVGDYWRVPPKTTHSGGWFPADQPSGCGEEVHQVVFDIAVQFELDLHQIRGELLREYLSAELRDLYREHSKLHQNAAISLPHEPSRECTIEEWNLLRILYLLTPPKEIFETAANFPGKDRDLRFASPAFAAKSVLDMAFNAGDSRAAHLARARAARAVLLMLPKDHIPHVWEGGYESLWTVWHLYTVSNQLANEGLPRDIEKFRLVDKVSLARGMWKDCEGGGSTSAKEIAIILAAFNVRDSRLWSSVLLRLVRDRKVDFAIDLLPIAGKIFKDSELMWCNVFMETGEDQNNHEVAPILLRLAKELVHSWEEVRHRRDCGC